MAKRINVGAIIKGRDGKADYIKVNEDVVLKKGEYLNLESKASQIASITAAIENGKLSSEVGEKMLANVEKTPEFIRFNITKST